MEVFERKWPSPRRVPPAKQLGPLGALPQGFGVDLRQAVGDRPKLPPPLYRQSVDLPETPSPKSEAKVTTQGQPTFGKVSFGEEPEPDDVPPTLREVLQKEIRAGLRKCTSIQVLDATLASARGKFRGRCPREGARIVKVLQLFSKAQGPTPPKKVAKQLSQVLRQEGEHRRFALVAEKKQRRGEDRRKELFFAPRKAVGRRSELNAGTLASLLQWAEVESEDLEKLIKTAFRQVSRGGRLNREDLPKALRHCRFKDVREQWVEEIYEGITMVPFVEAEDFEKFVNEYAEKQQEAYAEAFRKFDVDESDQISTQELQEVLRSLGFVVQPSLVSEIMEKVDYDGSGELSFDEFETLMKLLEDSDGFPQMEQDELKTVFRRFNSAGGGSLDVQGFAGVLTWLGHSVDFQDVQEIFDRADCKDKMDYNGFVLAMKAVRELQMKRLSEVFEECDKDHNGTLNINELESALKALKFESDPQVILEVVSEVQEVRSQLRSNRMIVDLTFEDVLDFVQRYRSREGLSQNELDELTSAFRRYEYENSRSVRWRDAYKVLNWFGLEVEAEEAEKYAAKVDVDNSGQLSLQDMKKVLRMEYEASLKRYSDAFADQDTGSGEINNQQATELFIDLGLESRGFANSFELGLLSAFRQGGLGYTLESFVRNCVKRKKTRIQEIRQTGNFPESKVTKLREIFDASSTKQGQEQVISAQEVVSICREIFVLGVVEPLRPSFTELLRDVERRPPPITFQIFIRHMRNLMQLAAKDLGFREKWAIIDTSFKSQEVQEFRELYMANVGEEKAHRVRCLLPVPLMTLPELRRALGNDKSAAALNAALQAVKTQVATFSGKDTSDKPNMIVNFPQFLRIAHKMVITSALLT